MPYSATVIAYAFVRKGIEERNYVTQMKLQKLVYFAHGYHLAKYGEPLIEEAFEAWKFGPVVPGIYHNYKLYGSDRIFSTELILDAPDDFDTIRFSASAMDAIDYTWQVTRHLTASQLSTWSHLEGSPWARVYNPALWSEHIDNNVIKEYFKNLIAAPVPE